MKNKFFIPISIILSFFITGCVTPNPGGGGETPPVTDKGYLKIERQRSSIISPTIIFSLVTMDIYLKQLEKMRKGKMLISLL